MDEAEDIAEVMGIKSLPHVQIFQSGATLASYTGSDLDELRQVLAKVLPSVALPAPAAPAAVEDPALVTRMDATAMADAVATWLAGPDSASVAGMVASCMAAHPDLSGGHDDDDVVSSLLSFRVPKLSPSGTCSAEAGGLEEHPFDLGAMLGIPRSEPERSSHPEALRVWRLACVVRRMAELTRAEWVGVYRRVPDPEAAVHGAPCCDVLMKEAYVGSPSRALFPLTWAFAAHSNNSTVGLTGRAAIYHDTLALAGAQSGTPSESHAESAGSESASSSESSATATASTSPAASVPYYVCDTRVRFELCAPIVSAKSGQVIGIVDLEAWRPRALSSSQTAMVLHFCAELGRLELGRTV